MDSGLFADIHVFPGDAGYWVLLLDVSADAQQRRQLQQRHDDLSLLQEQHAQVLWQQVSADVFLNLDQIRREALMDASLLADVCAALQILVLKRLQGGAYRVIESIPAYAEDLHATIRIWLALSLRSTGDISLSAEDKCGICDFDQPRELPRGALLVKA
jgi:hypothetical protein